MTECARRRRRRALTLRIAKGVQWVGVLWNFLCWGYALWDLAASPRLSDAVGDAVTVALLGGFGFTLAWLLARLIRGFVIPRPATRVIALPMAAAAIDGDRDRRQVSGAGPSTR